MPDWTKTMTQTFEYYIVDPGTWKDKSILRNVKSCTITRDAEVDTLGSATLDINEPLGECYVRIYLITIQNGITEKHPLGTFIVQTPTESYDGKVSSVSMDAYTPLLELKENPPPIGYSLLEDENIMESAYLITRDNVRAPVVKTECDEKLYYDFVSDTNDTWLKFVKDLIANARYEFALDELGRILYSPMQDTASLQSVHTYNDGNSSILYPEITMNRDIYKIPNVVEVVYSNGKDCYRARVVNDDPNSPISTVNRGREIIYRETNPNITGNPTENYIKDYATRLLKAKSSVEYKVSYTHGYCGTRLGDCVRLDYKRAGINDVKAKIISQNIKCEPGCPVSEKAVFTNKLWG
jgi:hypothetical protein